MPAGRPKIDIKQEIFEELCNIQATQEEIAAVFNCHEDTIRNWCKRTYGTEFFEVYKKFSSGGKMSLRRAQMRLAETSAAMAIWLGKQYLGQREPEQSVKVLAEIEDLTPLADLLNDNKNSTD